MLTLNVKDENSREFKEAENEFLSLLNNEDFKAFGYVGLTELYTMSNESEKIKEIILKISEDPKLVEKVLFHAMRGNPKTAIKLLESWKEIYPGDVRRVNPLIQQLKTRDKEGF